MTLRGRLFLLVTLLIVTSIPATAAVFAYGYWQSILERTQDNGLLLARLLAQSISFNQQTPAVVDDLVSAATLAQANMIAHLIQIAQKHKASPRDINRSLQQVAAREEIAEIWVTDRQGVPRFWSLPDLEATLSIESGLTQQPAFRPVLEGRKYTVVTDLARRDLEGQEIYYVGVAMPDQNGMVLIARQPGRLNESINRIGLKRLMEAVVSSALIDTIRVFDYNFQPLAVASSKGVNDATALTSTERRLLEKALNTGAPASYLEHPQIYDALLGYTPLQVAAPVFGADGLPEGATLVNLSIDMRDSLQTLLAMGSGLTVLLLAVGLALALPFLNRVVQPLTRLTVQTHRLVERHFDADPEMEMELAQVSAGRRDEVAYLGGALRSMVATLKTYIVNLKETTAAKERIEGELAAARSIQMGMLPRDFTRQESAGYDLYAVLEPAKAVGGDLFDFFMLDDHRLFFLIGDVSDKGVPAALFMAVTKTLFTAEAQRDSTSVSRIMKRVNTALCQNNPEGMFVTVFAGILDLRSGAIVGSDGGHDPPLALRPGGVEVVKKQGGMALGIFTDAPYQEWTIPLAPGEGLAIYTDGVSEAMNAAGQMFGAQRLLDVLRELDQTCPAVAIAEGVMNAVRAFVGGHPQSDDITLLALRWVPRTFHEPSLSSASESVAEDDRPLREI